MLLVLMVSTGGALVMPVSGGTLSLGLATTSGDTAATEGEAYSVTYSWWSNRRSWLYRL